MEAQFPRFKPTDLPDSFTMIGIAARRSGKTTLVESLLEEFGKSKHHKFTAIFLLSATNAGFENQIPVPYRYTDLGNLGYILRKQAQVKEYNLKEPLKKNRIKSRVLIIVDDLIGEQKGKNSLKYNDDIRKLFVNGRHLGNDGVDGNGVNVIVLSQQFSAIPKVARLNSDLIITNRITSKMERKDVLDSFFTLGNGRDASKIASDTYESIVLSKPFRFVVIETFRANRVKLEDYIKHYDANVNKDGKVKQTHQLGDEYDWSRVAESNSIFK
tara:strand:+ start:138 stop:950 length:813 start_codon:yes stop_codon:yes gene_type:complete